MSKKVLIICYYWPPAGGPGVQRWLKFVKYLSDFDIEPIVYTPENPNYPIVDTSMLDEVPDSVTIIKRPIKEPYRFASMLSRKQTQTISAGIVPKNTKQSLIQRLLLYIRGNFFVPDARVGWVQPSVTFLENYMKEHAINTVITTGPPHSMHLIGLQLKAKITAESSRKLQWITDFRDPWTTIGYHDKLKMTAKTKRKHKNLERNVLETADHVIVTSPTTKKEFRAITQQPITVITNGFDTSHTEAVDSDEKFTVSHIGSLLSDRNPIILWKVFAKLVKEHDPFAAHFSLKLVGKVSQEVIDTIKNHGLEKYLTLVGYVSHQEAIKLQQQAAVLLLIEINAEITKGIIPGKVFEYLAAKRPILGIGPKNADVGEIITSTKSGYYLDYDQEESLEKVLITLFENYKASNDTESNEEAISKYHRKELTHTLATLIHQL
ncbi:glycosyl transferase family 1 [Dokdonia pacifica]|uniref:Glycosyltransferase involved in cell wall bisynthesis n=1 Tax=Dokdonia pacifica TaxID=1627892 RepID=A0A239DUN2_9FLAO|nr:glycosyltransferase family 4 protein [Dokdonia pacifica]GGG41224.1 glycosyl transferase family 1 [Dokdonia pacifica]SNS36156.1 Glycosyltransferase involved in cell wall bisynthesis [Dokdonia pacifica]